MEEINFTNSFNDTLYGHSWTINSPKFILLIVTGMAEHSARYNDFAEFINSNGGNVYCLDHYGQGLGKNGELGNPGKDYFFKMEDTINEFIKSLKKEFNSLPMYLFSHSMGSFVAQGYIEKYSNTIDKVILCGTNGKSILYKLGYLVSLIIVHKFNSNKKAKLLHGLSIGAYEKTVKNEFSKNAWISFNKNNVINYDNDPFCGYVPTNGFYKEFLKGLSSIQKKENIKNISKKLQILIIGGEYDAVSNNAKGLKSLHRLYKKYGLDSKLIIYEDMRHEILNEEEHKKVYQDIIEFLE